jgi:hypothetical protein
MGTDHPAELAGQISINELLDEPIGTEPIQLVLPIHFHLGPASVLPRPDAGNLPRPPQPPAG